MAGLPKKYAKMGFKKGWTAYRRSKGNSAPKRRVNVMAKGKGSRRRTSKAKPSILTLAGLGYSTYNAYKEAMKAGGERLNTFIYVFTGVGLGRWSVNGRPTFNSTLALKSAAPIAIGYGASYLLNKQKDTKYLIKKIPIMKRFRW